MGYVVFHGDLWPGLGDLWAGRRATRRGRLELLRRTGCDRPELDAQLVKQGGLDEEVEFVVTSDHHIGQEQLQEWPKMKMLSGAFTGVGEGLKAWLRANPVVGYYVPGYATESTAELAVSLALAVLRKIPIGDWDVRHGEWDQRARPGENLAGRRVAIVGTGKIGVRAAQLFRSFGCEVIGWHGDHTRNPAFEAAGGEYIRDLDALLSMAQVVSLHLPALRQRGPKDERTTETAPILDGSRIELLHRDTIVINVARGSLVDESALAVALRDHKILGAGLDVLGEEERRVAKTQSPFVHLDNVVLAPHVGFKTRASLRRLACRAIANVGRYLRNPGDPKRRIKL